jgi:hypothetical protein
MKTHEKAKRCRQKQSDQHQNQNGVRRELTLNSFRNYTGLELSLEMTPQKVSMSNIPSSKSMTLPIANLHRIREEVELDTATEMVSL